MGRQTIKAIIDLDNRDTKRRLMGAVGAMSGMYEVKLKPRRATRSLRQNAWMWSCIVAPFAQWLTEHQGEPFTSDNAHEVLKDRFLRVDVMNKVTGEIIGHRIQSTAELDTAAFSDYCEHCRDFLASTCDILVPDPDPELAGAR